MGDEGDNARVGRWRLVRELGSGTSSTVYEVVTDEGIRAALKLYAPRGRAYAVRGMREARASAGIEHPNLAAVIDAGVLRPEDDACQLYIVSRLVRGVPLAKALARTQLPPARARGIAIGVARGLAAAHERGVIHRDIKPSNVVLPDDADDEAAVLIDLGLAGFLERETGTTRMGEIYGTPLYMSPEQAAGGAQDARSDVWGLGVLLHEMLYGFTPFARDGVFETVAAIVREPLRLPPGDPALNAIIGKALAKDPRCRFEGAAQMAEALERTRAVGSRGPSTLAPMRPSPAGARTEGAVPVPCAQVPAARASLSARPIDRTAVDAEVLAAGSPRASSWLLPLGATVIACGLVALLAVLGVRAFAGGWWVLPGVAAAAAGFSTASILRRRRARTANARGKLRAARSKSARRSLMTASLALSVEELLAYAADNPQLRLVTASLALEVEQLADQTKQGKRQQAFENVLRLLEILERRTPRASLLERYHKLVTAAAAAIALVGSAAGLRSDLFAEDVAATLALEGCVARASAGARLMLTPRWTRLPDPPPSTYVWFVDGERAGEAGALTWTAPSEASGDHEIVVVTPGYRRASCTVQVSGAAARGP